MLCVFRIHDRTTEIDSLVMVSAFANSCSLGGITSLHQHVRCQSASYKYVSVAIDTAAQISQRTAYAHVAELQSSYRRGAKFVFTATLASARWTSWNYCLSASLWSAVILVAQATHNKSLDASGGSVFRIIIGPAMLE